MKANRIFRFLFPWLQGKQFRQRLYWWQVASSNCFCKSGHYPKTIQTIWTISSLKKYKRVRQVSVRFPSVCRFRLPAVSVCVTCNDSFRHVTAIKIYENHGLTSEFEVIRFGNSSFKSCYYMSRHLLENASTLSRLVKTTVCCLNSHSAELGQPVTWKSMNWLACS